MPDTEYGKDGVTDWSDGVALTAATLFQVKSGEALLSLNNAAPATRDGTELKAGDTANIPAGNTVRWKSGVENRSVIINAQELA